MTHWFAAGDTPDGPRRIALSGDKTVDDAGRSHAPILPVGDGPPDFLPTRVMPSDSDRVADLAQETPVDRISGWVRLWVLGLMTQRPRWDGVICARYGDVTHWIEVSADEAVSSRSTVTMRLCRDMQGASAVDTEALAASISRPERLAMQLYQAGLTDKTAAVTGHLVGAELASMRPYWLGRDVALLSDQPAIYSAALQAQGVPVSIHNPDALLHNGLAALARARGFAD